jgi:hypothetical protein
MNRSSHPAGPLLTGKKIQRGLRVHRGDRVQLIDQRIWCPMTSPATRHAMDMRAASSFLITRQNIG